MNSPTNGTNVDAAVDRSVGRAASKAHETVDRVAASVAPAMDRAKAAVESTTQSLQSTAQGFVDSGDAWVQDARSYVRERPLTALGVTALAAFLISRLWAR